MHNDHVGSSLDELLDDIGVAEEVHTAAVKRVLAWQLSEEMMKQKISKTKMAKKMKTSRTQIDRLLDPKNMQVQIDTVEKAAKALGRRLVMEIVEAA